METFSLSKHYQRRKSPLAPTNVDPRVTLQLVVVVVVRFLITQEGGLRFFCKYQGLSNIGTSKSRGWERR